MRKIYLFLGLVLLNFGTMAQSIELSDANTDEVIANGDTLFVEGVSNLDMVAAHVKVKNITANALSAIVTREDLILPGNMAVNFCFGENCYPPFTMESNPEQIEANSYLPQTLDIDLAPKGTEGIALIKITVSDQANAEDFSSFFVKFYIAPVGIASEGMNFDIFPNPASDFLNITVDGVSSQSRVELYDALGKVVNSQNLTGFNNRLDLIDLQNGLYFIKLMDGNNVIETRKIIKR